MADGVSPLLDIKYYCIVNTVKRETFDGEKAKRCTRQKASCLKLVVRYHFPIKYPVNAT